MKFSSIIKTLILLVLFTYLIFFIQANQQRYLVYFPWLEGNQEVNGIAWVVIGISLCLGFLGSALWMLIKSIFNFFSPSGRLSRSMKKVEEKYYYGIEALSKGDNEAASVFFEEILSADPDNFRTLIKFGELLRETGKVQRAISLHLQALALSQNNIKVLHELSLDYIAGRNTVEAKKMLSAIIKLSPKGNIGIHRQLRDILVAEKDWTKAIEVQNNLITMVYSSEDKEKEMLLLCGMEYESAIRHKKNRDLQRAIQILESIIARNAKFLPAHLALGECYAESGDHDSAENAWFSGYEATDSVVILGRMESYFLSRDMPERAIELYRKVISSGENVVLPKLLLGKLFYHLSMNDQAMSIFEEIDEEFEYAPVLFYFMGKIQLRKGERAEAAETFRSVVKSSGVLEAEFVCRSCKATHSKYSARCTSCGTWNSIELNVQEDKSAKEEAAPIRPVYM